jgi:hypothetical protein
MWQYFYAIIGTAAATLTGLMFVVVTLTTRVRARGSGDGIATFNTPTVVHFCVALAVATILTAPWHTLWHASLLLGLAGLGGVGYVGLVARRMLRLGNYRAVLEDWIWHVVFTLVAYGALVVAALMLPSQPVPALFVIGAMAVSLLFIGIHNAWDVVTYLLIEFGSADIEKPE